MLFALLLALVRNEFVSAAARTAQPPAANADRYRPVRQEPVRDRCACDTFIPVVAGSVVCRHGFWRRGVGVVAPALSGESRTWNPRLFSQGHRERPGCPQESDGIVVAALDEPRRSRRRPPPSVRDVSKTDASHPTPRPRLDKRVRVFGHHRPATEIVPNTLVASRPCILDPHHLP